MPDSAPLWDLSDLYKDTSDKSIATDLAGCGKAAKALAKKWRGRIDKAKSDELAAIIAEYERILEILGKATSHAQLLFAANSADQDIARHHQSVRESGADIIAEMLFIELEIAKLDNKHMERLIGGAKSGTGKSGEAAGLARWRPWLRRVRAMAPHQLDPDMERMLAERAPSGRESWVRLFDETAAALRFPFRGAEVTEAEILNSLSSPDGDERREAGASLSSTLLENQRLFALVLNTIAKDKQVEDRWRGFARPVSARNLDNDVDDDVVDALVSAVDSRNQDLAHRYYALKAGWLGGKSLDWWDRNAPLGEDDTKYSWAEATGIVMEAFAGFDQEMAEIAEPFFRQGWIDAAPRPGKSSGAFSHPVTPSAHPYILMNFSGRSRDVMTLAHEMGHGIHQRLAADCGYLMSDTPLTLAETASVFAEMLAFRRLVDSCDDRETRRRLLAGKVEDMLNTVVRQIAFHNFETRFHDARGQAELTADEIGDIWIETQRAALGPAVRIGDDYRSVWGYVPHFVHTPFYVYAYAFGDCLVNALWQTSRAQHEAGRGDMFTANYRALLAAGGTERYDVALSRFGLDVRDAGFWAIGLDMISGMIDELEGLS